jgi:hypothetical protein
VHCEDARILQRTGQDLIGAGRGAIRHFPEARPVSAEVEAIDQAVELARGTGAPVYVVHLSSAAALGRCQQARAAGLPVYVETRPLYLHLTRERFDEPDAAKYVGAPPLRDQSDRDALWRGLAAGEVDTVCSDHAPWTLAAKLDPALDVVTARQGVADLETLMPMLFSEGVATGRISLDRFVELTSARAAHLFGLYPRKARSPSAPTPTSGCGIRSSAESSTGRACSRARDTRCTTAGACGAGPGSSCAAASSCWPTAPQWPSPVRGNGSAAIGQDRPSGIIADDRPRRIRRASQRMGQADWPCQSWRSASLIRRLASSSWPAMHLA